MRALSLEYHDVVGGHPDESGFPGAGPASYKLSREQFNTHLAAIASRSIRPATRVVDWSPHTGSASPLFLTFDDGGVSAYTFIADALEQHGWRGHFFVTAGRIGTAGFLSAMQIRELHRRGHTVGSHSFSHPARMGALDKQRLLQEWTTSVAALSDLLGTATLTGSVPGGFYTSRVAETAEAAGLRYLFTSEPSTSCRRVGECLVLGRYTLRRWSSAETASAIASWHRPPRLLQWALYSSLTAARHLAGDRYTWLRQLYWNRGA